LFENIGRTQAFKVFLDWWLGDALGALVIAPLILIWERKKPLELFKNKTFVLMSVLLVLTSGLAFSGGLSKQFGLYLLLFFPIPLLIGMAFLYQIKGAVLGLSLLTLSSVLAIHDSSKVMRGEDVHYQLVLLFSFLTSSGVISFLCAAAIQEQQRHEKLLEGLFSGTANYTGEDYLKNLIKNLSELLNTKYAFVGEVNECRKSVKTISVYGHGSYQENFSYLLEGTPCDNVMQEETCSYPRHIQDLFPKDKILVQMNAESYIGALLFDSQKQALGIVAVLDTEEIVDEKTACSVLNIFAQRAGVELERKNKDAQLLEAKNIAESSNTAKNEFFAVMSHELRTPMNVILGMSDALLEVVKDESQIKYLEIQKRAASGLLELLSDILDVSKIERGILVKHDNYFSSEFLFQSVLDIIDPSRDNPQLKVDFMSEMPSNFFGDSQRIRQILLNIIGNALKFTPNGKVNIQVSFEKQSEAKGQLVVMVIDNGIGIPKEKLEEILMPFTQVDSSNSRKYGGSGLGLSIVNKLIELLGGKLTIQSEVDKGSIFEVIIPVGYTQEDIADDKGPKTEISRTLVGHQSILLAEDSEDNVELIKLYLKNTDYQLEVVSNGEQALKACKSKKYDLVLMDIQMPMMDGLEATKKIRDFEERNALQPVSIFALTANAQMNDIEETKRAGFNRHIIKPIQKQSFLNSLGEHFNTAE
jgi:signal transduction histidine kinase/CheY-like chemotaxis protein